MQKESESDFSFLHIFTTLSEVNFHEVTSSTKKIKPPIEVSKIEIQEDVIVVDIALQRNQKNTTLAIFIKTEKQKNELILRLGVLEYIQKYLKPREDLITVIQKVEFLCFFYEKFGKSGQTWQHFIRLKQNLILGYTRIEKIRQHFLDPVLKHWQLMTKIESLRLTYYSISEHFFRICYYIENKCDSLEYEEELKKNKKRALIKKHTKTQLEILTAEAEIKKRRNSTLYVAILLEIVRKINPQITKEEFYKILDKD